MAGMKFLTCFLSSGFSNYFYHGLLPERQSHGHEASCFMEGPLTSERLRDNMQDLQLD